MLTSIVPSCLGRQHGAWLMVNRISDSSLPLSVATGRSGQALCWQSLYRLRSLGSRRENRLEWHCGSVRTSSWLVLTFGYTRQTPRSLWTFAGSMHQSLRKPALMSAIWILPAPIAFILIPSLWHTRSRTASGMSWALQ